MMPVKDYIDFQNVWLDKFLDNKSVKLYPPNFMNEFSKNRAFIFLETSDIILLKDVAIDLAHKQCYSSPKLLLFIKS